MERPALQRLLSDVQAGSVDSLADFAKLVELFDAHCTKALAQRSLFRRKWARGVQVF
jgi:hypothetical protein